MTRTLNIKDAISQVSDSPGDAVPVDETVGQGSEDEEFEGAGEEVT
jgi:hypothetical protein